LSGRVSLGDGVVAVGESFVAVLAVGFGARAADTDGCSFALGDVDFG
jgi:hypothetical protein